MYKKHDQFPVLVNKDDYEKKYSMNVGQGVGYA